MNPQIIRGRTRLRLLLGAVCVIFLVNIFYPLYLSPPGYTNRIMPSALMLTFAAFAYKGTRNMRVIISGVLFVLALVNSLVFFAALSERKFGASLFVGSIMSVFVLIGWLLLKSPSLRAFEAARQHGDAKI